MNYPETFREELVENIHGYQVSDPYRWLENGDDSKVQVWVDQQNALTTKTLSEHADPNKYVNELTDILNVTMFGLPRKNNKKYFWTEKKGNQNQSVLYVKTGLDGEPKLLIDLNSIDKTGLTSLDYWMVSRNGKYVCYGISKSGDENSTMYLLNSDSGEELVDFIPYTGSTSACWLPDDTGFFYCRYPTPGTVPKGEELYHRKVYFHNLGDDWTLDKLVFGDGRAIEDRHSISLTLDGKYLFIETSANWTKSELSVIEVNTGKVKSIINGLDNLFHATTLDNKVYVRTDYKANNYRVLVSDINSIPESIDDWQELISESDSVLEAFQITVDKFLALYSSNLSDRISSYDHSGKYLCDLPIPKFSCVGGLSTSKLEKEFFYSISNFFCGNTIYHWNPDINDVKEYRKTDLSLPEDDYALSQEWCVSKDGEKIPMFIFHKKGIIYDGTNKAAMYGYGGFGSSVKPGFYSSYVPFLNRGGVLVVANIRGGSEFGESWHRDGMLDKKMNSFYDFIVCAEYLIDKKITSSDKLAILGGSNGGLLVAACMILRPELFKAVVCMVPLLDMVRFPNFLMAKRWVFEYGDPKKKADFEKIIKWSPYHNVKDNVKYPSILFEIANKDVRVDPLHSRKMTALMQHANKENLVLLRTEKKAGHGPGKSKEVAIKQHADTLAFLEWQLR